MARKGGLAKEIRAGLEPEQAMEKPLPLQSSLLEEVWMRKTIRQHLQEFAQVFALIFLIISGVIAYKRGANTANMMWFLAALTMLAVAYVKPIILHPAWKAWMALGHYLGVVMSFVILFLAWNVMLVPITFILKILGIKVMDTRYKAPVDSYWEERDAKLNDFSLLRRQY